MRTSSCTASTVGRVALVLIAWGVLAGGVAQAAPIEIHVDQDILTVAPSRCDQIVSKPPLLEVLALRRIRFVADPARVTWRTHRPPERPRTVFDRHEELHVKHRRQEEAGAAHGIS